MLDYETVYAILYIKQLIEKNNKLPQASDQSGGSTSSSQTEKISKSYWGKINAKEFLKATNFNESQDKKIIK